MGAVGLGHRRQQVGAVLDEAVNGSLKRRGHGPTAGFAAAGCFLLVEDFLYSIL